MLIYDWWFRQSVTEENMNDAFGAVQTADHNLMTDQQLVGVAFGGTVAQTAPTPNLSVAVAETYAYDQLGQRIFTAGDSVDCSQDYNHVSTAVVGAGNEKWLSLFILFERNLSDPVIDGNGFTVYYVQAESYEYQVVQGAEAPAGTATRPALINPGLLLADVLLVYGQTQILTADILQAPTSTLDGKTGRMANTFSIVQSPFSVIAGNVPAAIAAMLTDLNEHVNGTSGEHPATAITAAAVAGTPFSLPASTTVQADLAAVVPPLNVLLNASSIREFLFAKTSPGTLPTLAGSGGGTYTNAAYALTFSGCTTGDIIEIESDFFISWVIGSSAGGFLNWLFGTHVDPATYQLTAVSEMGHLKSYYVITGGDPSSFTVKLQLTVETGSGVADIDGQSLIGRHYRSGSLT